ncbi:hypothetical protein I8G32_04625 [Rhodopseudomonas palustris]|uniref:DUF3240 family protein n=2 Tax=Rhodopseudomonas palustris TaxID=1076 RepID=Q6N1C8_RHOPA|nr:DUF3240 family protein [Rhodopseudomonas palustris]OPF96061.1 hypothetical protein B1S06_04120 [Rhodopseudomonas palustris]PPQ41976.1 DUF3240 domain-containing protein [Rhodopseudomonas palustris]QLH73421.1 DUF3240 family protein [Rhodopseudomonas palustris]QQM06049.1 hypothetical protein I8G32_04625 [Rhodopseudomonas palustris]RIA02154.1 DUF3240 domain-containing protein [Rhodopseudomonas palustris]
MSVMVLTLLVPVTLKDDVIAAMLSHGPTARAGFTAREVEGYGRDVDYDSVVEQVRGHTLSVEIVVTAEDAELRGLLDAIGDEFAGRGLRWRIVAAPAVGTL